MPTISAEDGYLTVLNLFLTDTPERQGHLLGAMRDIVDTAAFPGWISSTVHSGQQRLGTANFIQWRSKEDLEARYSEDVFKHRTMPLFTEITTSIRLLQTQVAASYRSPDQGEATEISPTRDDYAAIEIFQVAGDDQQELVDKLVEGEGWLAGTPGWRSHSVLRGVGARNLEGAFVVSYSQWDDKASYDTYRALPEAEQPVEMQKARSRVDALATSTFWNTYRVVHTRSAGQQPVSAASLA